MGKNIAKSIKKIKNLILKHCITQLKRNDKYHVLSKSNNHNTNSTLLFILVCFKLFFIISKTADTIRLV